MNRDDRPIAPDRNDPDTIPVLTERLYVPTLPPLLDPSDPPAVAEATPAPTAVAPEPVAEPPVTSQAQPHVPVAPPPPVVDIGAVRDALLDDLESTLPAQIDSMIRREVSNAIDDAVFRVVAETQDALARAIGQVVERAVKDELARLRNDSG